MIKHPWLLLLGLCLAFLIGNIDITALNLALVWIQKDLTLTLSGIDWVFNGYILAFAAFLVPAGRFSDMYGPKAIFIFGMIVFSIFTFLCGIATTGWLLIFSRIMQGVGAAFFWPTIQATIMKFEDPAMVRKSTSLIMLSTAVGLSGGPLAAGYIIEYLSWHWIFFLNLPFCLAALLLILFFYPSHTYAKRPKKIDIIGIIFLVLFCFSIVYAVDLGGKIGFRNRYTLGWFAGAIGVLWLFVVREDNVSDPLFRINILKKQSFILGVFFRMTAAFSFFSVLFFLGYLLQNINLLKPDQAGFYFLPMTVLMGIASFLTGFFVHRISIQTNLITSLFIFGIGVLFLAIMTLFALNFFMIMFPILLCGFGFGLLLPNSNLFSLQDLDKDYIGVGNGILYMGALVSGSIGIVAASSFMRTPGVELALQLMNESNIELNQMKITLVHHMLSGIISLPEALTQFSDQAKEAYLAVKEGFLYAMRIDLFLCAGLLIAPTFVFVLYERVKR